MNNEIIITIDAIRGDDGRIYIEAQSGHMVPVNYMKINLIEYPNDHYDRTDPNRAEYEEILDNGGW